MEKVLLAETAAEDRLRLLVWIPGGTRQGSSLSFTVICVARGRRSALRVICGEDDMEPLILNCGVVCCLKGSTSKTGNLKHIPRNTRLVPKGKNKDKGRDGGLFSLLSHSRLLALKVETRCQSLCQLFLCESWRLSRT